MRVLIVAVILAVLASCAPAPPITAFPPPPTQPPPTLVPSAAFTPLPAPAATLIPTPFPTPTHFPTHFCQPQALVLPGHFLLSRPIPVDGRQRIEPSYRYGATAGGSKEIHHGVEMLNAGGTPVLAAADGLVLFAGPDSGTLFGPHADFYGNLVVLAHELPGVGMPIYTLYAHLSEVHAAEGQVVQRGDWIGDVGLTGVAAGTHLHFEVRTDAYDYDATRNPDLWLGPLTGEGDEQTGAIAGYVLDPYGEVLTLQGITIEPQNGYKIFLEPYQDETVNGDDDWGENFAVGELPPGWYTLTVVYGTVYKIEVEVLPGQLTLVPVCLDQ
ncbi:MAG: M23 family metallopeptidase [Anaerolineae bacterium]|nr:M23 family metallopeptidase [Anaerolineae bacterium]